MGDIASTRLDTIESMADALSEALAAAERRTDALDEALGCAQRQAKAGADETNLAWRTRSLSPAETERSRCPTPVRRIMQLSVASRPSPGRKAVMQRVAAAAAAQAHALQGQYEGRHADLLAQPAHTNVGARASTGAVRPHLPLPAVHRSSMASSRTKFSLPGSFSTRGAQLNRESDRERALEQKVKQMEAALEQSQRQHAEAEGSAKVLAQALQARETELGALAEATRHDARAQQTLMHDIERLSQRMTQAQEEAAEWQERHATEACKVQQERETKQVEIDELKEAVQELERQLASTGPCHLDMTGKLAVGESDNAIGFRWAKFSQRDKEVTGMDVVLCAPEKADANITNGEQLVGKMAAVHRGGCTFQEKTERLIAAGAAGVIIINSEDELFEAAATYPDGTLSSYSANIPVAMIKAKDAQALLVCGNSSRLRPWGDEPRHSESALCEIQRLQQTNSKLEQECAVLRQQVYFAQRRAKKVNFLFVICTQPRNALFCFASCSLIHISLASRYNVHAHLCSQVVTSCFLLRTCLNWSNSSCSSLKSSSESSSRVETASCFSATTTWLAWRKRRSRLSIS